MQTLAELVAKNKAILGLAMRTNIYLGKGKLNLLRQIEEMFHALYIKHSLKIFERAESISCITENSGILSWDAIA